MYSFTLTRSRSSGMGPITFLSRARFIRRHLFVKLWTRAASPILPGPRADLFLRAREAFASSRARRRRMVSPLCVVLCGSESRIISETSSERSTGRSASLLGPAVCDHPARINPSSVLGVTAERFTRLYISILFFASDRERAFTSRSLGNYKTSEGSHWTRLRETVDRFFRKADVTYILRSS